MVQNSQNNNQVSSDLLAESTNSFIRAAVGNHQICHPTYCGNPLECVGVEYKLGKQYFVMERLLTVQCSDFNFQFSFFICQRKLVQAPLDVHLINSKLDD